MSKNQTQPQTTLPFTGERVLPETGTDVVQNDLLGFHQFFYQHIAQSCLQQHVLDIGCGSGHGLHTLAQQTGGHVTGMDISWPAVSFAAGYYPDLAQHVLVSDALHLAVEAQRFDTICAIEVIEHVAPAETFLREIKRVLQPGGRCFLTTPNRLVHSPGREKPMNPFHLIEYSFEELDTLLKQTFDVVEIYSIMLMQRVFQVRYMPPALLDFRLPFPLAHIERFLYWHMPPWNRRFLQPTDLAIQPAPVPGCWGFFAICS